MASHYPRSVAFTQKARALIGRSLPQARDVFDLDLLLSGSPDLAATLPDAERTRARERALAIGYDEFKSQVVAYLPAERQVLYASPEIWREMVSRVVEAMEPSSP
jgi:hypothetical protein